jgi:cysteine desulfurase/selenocysteine lyase
MVAALNHGNPGRSGHGSAVSAEELTSRVRRQVASEFGVPDSGAVIFTAGATMSLNLAIKGILRRGDHAITTSFEHNSVLRPLKAAERSCGCTLSIVKCADPALLPDLISRELRPSTRLVAVTHASNVTGALLPVSDIAKIAHTGDVVLLVDSAQVVGHLRFHLADLGADLVAFGAHKGLRGPPGVGVLIVANTRSVDLEPLVNGGTGLHSDELLPPHKFPSAYEAGTPNLPAIAGLEAAITFLNSSLSHEEKRTAQLLKQDAVSKLSGIKDVTLLAPDSSSPVPVFSLTIRDWKSARIAEALDHRYQLQVRGGLHCAPLMHESLGTQFCGAVRVSFGPGNTYEAVNRLLSSISELAMRGVD